jgi:hypothetical protein
MSINESLYPSYPGNPQRLDPDYSEGDDTVAGATDYNKHDDEILKHQLLLQNLNIISGASLQNLFDKVNVVGTDITANSLTTTLNLRTGSGIAFSSDNITKTMTISALNFTPLNINGSNANVDIDIGNNSFKTSEDFLGASTTAEYFGDSATNGTWKIVRDGENLSILKRISGSYIEQARFEEA